MKPEYLINADHLTVILCPLEKQDKILEHLKKEVLVANLEKQIILKINSKESLLIHRNRKSAY